ncbi:MarR family winged helix-turn-helix transcriptional regulator [Anaerostipes sp.]|uniref:MarR family winged helix-turn-helix transcriptional regulator n=1 Tax=Anaerostipes sp. TaxID=1872530 RepID=UPI0025BF3D26|nr:MarR family winged helix-turn-helix transcriptional regulator [Anaerostipes sp.]MBS7008091.1 winged helix-turn-helix transcriptional regulator [Anaerostipes sp.]
MKDKNWLESMKKLGAVRLFSSLYVKKSRKGALTSAQEVDLLFRTAFAGDKMTPLELSRAMGASKTIVSRLIEDLKEKKLITKLYNRGDKRSYSLKITEEGKEELDRMYHYYLGPLYELQENLGEENFELLMKLIEKANKRKQSNI